MKTFGQVLSETMKAQGVTQNELAERSGVYQSYISKLLTGHTLGGVTGAPYDKPTARLFADAVGEAFSRKPFIR